MPLKLLYCHREDISQDLLLSELFFFNCDCIVLQGTYWTIHITPEPEFSYVSFETNLSQTSYDDLVRKVVDIFKPGKFVTTLFVNQVSVKLRCVPSQAYCLNFVVTVRLMHHVHHSA